MLAIDETAIGHDRLNDARVGAVGLRQRARLAAVGFLPKIFHFVERQPPIGIDVDGLEALGQPAVFPGFAFAQHAVAVCIKSLKTLFQRFLHRWSEVMRCGVCTARKQQACTNNHNRFDVHDVRS
jgi:hypothetical protein